MAYLARQDIIFDGATFHITWKCHNDTWLLKEDTAKQLYYDLLLKYKDRHGIAIYSYSFMDNHPHITGTINTVKGLSALMQVVNSQFARKINKIKKRRGQVIMDRFKSPVIQDDRALTEVMIYGDLNAARAGIVSHPKEYKWCSFLYYTDGKDDPLITPAPSYLALGSSAEERQHEYRQRVDSIVEEEGLDKRNYSKTFYIGNPDWVEARYKELREIRKTKHLAYVMRQRKFLYSNSPPS